MADAPKGILTIRFVNGTEQKFEFSRQPQDDPKLASRIEEGLRSNYLLLESGDRLTIIPTFGIQSVEVSPAPGKLPANTLRDARRLP